MERFVKLVRDKIGDHLSDPRVVYKPMPPGEYIQALRMKLIEEAVEYAFNPTEEELADVLEVFSALCHYDIQVLPGVVRGIARMKRDDRGGFDRQMGMYVSTSAGRFS